MSEDRRRPSRSDVETLWAAASIPPDPERVRRAAIGARVDLVVDVAAQHKVSPLVIRTLAGAGIDMKSLGAAALRQNSAWEARALLAIPAAAKLAIGPLSEAGMRPLVLKGLALADRYPEPHLRPMDDIDLLLPRSMARQASAVLTGAGWRRVSHVRRDPGYDLVFVHPSSPGVPVELHYEFVERRDRPPRFDARRLWNARTPTMVHGLDVWALPPELELVALVVHAAKPYHLFGRLLWAVDLAVVAAAHRLDWEGVARIASDARRRVALAVALRFARRLGADVPDELTALPRVLERAGALDALLDPARPFWLQPTPRHLAFGLVDDTRGKLRLVVNDLVWPPGGMPRSRMARNLVRTLGHGAWRLVRATLGRRYVREHAEPIEGVRRR